MSLSYVSIGERANSSASLRLATVRLGLFLVAHALLGLVLPQSPVLATIHAIATVVTGLFLAGFSLKLQRIVYVAGYIAGAEVLWRMTEAQIFWETGKYAIALLLAIALLRFFGRWRDKLLPVGYFLLLLPSIALTIEYLGPSDEARQQISFNLAGPLSLAICALFFSQVRADGDDIRRLLWFTVAPLVAIATSAAVNTVDEGTIEFTAASNVVTSGGFGPNQVSAALGLGVTLCALLAIGERRLSWRWIALGVAVWFTAQTLLTLSRGGVFNAAVALTLGTLFYIREPGRRIALAVMIFAVVTIVGYAVIPTLDAYTRGALRERFTEFDSTNRFALIKEDLETWREHPLFGVGPGMAREFREDGLLSKSAAHTEFTRLLAEHGVVGLLALVLLLLIPARAYMRTRRPGQKAWVLAMAGWALAEMSHSATRLAAISFVFGLTVIAWKEPEFQEHQPDDEASVRSMEMIPLVTR